MKQLIGLFFKSISFFVSRLPRPWREQLGDAIGFLWFDVFGIRRRVAVENVSIAFPELPLPERERIARASMSNLGRALVEYTLFPFFRREHIDSYFEIQGLEHVHAALKDGKGAIFLTLHLGNGDFGIAALSRLGLPINLISKEFKSRWLNDLWFGMRRKHGTKFISPEKSSFEILRALRRNEIIIFVLDQFMGPPIGVRTKFFGRETGTAAGLALMSSRTGTPVLPSYTFRKPGGRHVIAFEAPIKHLDDRPRDKNIAVLTQIYTDKIEDIVRRHPEQWMWIHRRWKEFRE